MASFQAHLSVCAGAITAFIIVYAIYDSSGLKKDIQNILTSIGVYARRKD